MQVSRKAARDPAPVEINLGRGAVLTAKPLDSFGHKMIYAEAHAELNALLAREPTKRKWASITAARLEEANQNDESRMALLNWMHGVLAATKCAVSLSGVDEVDEDGNVIAPLDASFETFELIFSEVLCESMFKAQFLKVESLWSAEKNVSGPGPNGSGPEASNTAPPAVMPETLAPLAENEIPTGPPPNSDADARSAATPPKRPKARSPGTSDAAAAPGASPA